MKFLSRVALILSCISLPLSARILSVNFEAGTTSSGDELAAADSAGVFSIAHWNNINVGTLNASHAVNVPSTPLKDDTGVATTGTIAINLASAYVGNSGSGSSTNNHKMMSSFVARNASDSGNISIANLPAPYTAGYSVYVYFDADANTRTFDITVDGTTIQAKDASTFNGTYKNAATTPLDANYVVFTGLTASSFSIIMDSDSGRAALNGIQIVSDDHPVPPTIQSFTVNDYYVAPGSPVTFSWETDGATTISIDQSVGDVTSLTSNGDGNISSNVASTTTYTLTATNVAGTATETLRVGAGVARPNIVFFMVDDMGWQDTSVPFHTSPTLFNAQYRTPNMEAIAASGRKFTRAYACAVCSPTRVSLMTGLNAARHKVTNWTLIQNQDQSDTSSTLHPPANWNVNGLGPAAETATRVLKTDVTLPRLLQQAGYRTIHAGKAHFGAAGLLGADPIQIGFDVNIAGHAAGGPASYYGTSNFGTGPFHVPGLEQYHGQDIFLTEALTLEMNKSIETAVQDGTPFFAYMANYAVHVPIQQDSRFSDNYPTLNSTERAYSTLVEGMDKSLGDIMAKLDALGVAENTLIIFYSDNGGISYAARGSSPYGGANTHNWPLRAGKGSCYEGGTRVPFIASWAKTDTNNTFQQNYPITANSTCNSPLIVEDMMPTVLKAAAVTIPSGIDGFDISGYINSTTGFERPNETFLFHYPHIWTNGAVGQNQGYEPYCSLVEGSWKVIYLYHNDRWELYDLATDIDENNNLSNSNPAKLMELSRKMIQLIEERTGQYPVNPVTSLPITLIMPNKPAVDTDNDGIPDNTEDANNNGLPDPGETNPDNDNSDGDNVKDGSEIKIGTDPLDPTSFFKLAQLVLPNGDLQITWPSAPGATFTLRSSADLDDWDVVATSIPASAGTTTSYNAGQTTGTSYFYHLELE